MKSVINEVFSSPFTQVRLNLCSFKIWSENWSFPNIDFLLLDYVASEIQEDLNKTN